MLHPLRARGGEACTWQLLRRARRLLLTALCAAGSALAQAAATGPAAAPSEAAARPGAMARVIGRTERLLVVVPEVGDTAAGLAERFLGRADRAHWLGEADAMAPGQPLVVPLQHPNPTGIAATGIQAVPVLSYHRFENTASATEVTPTQFDAQLRLLAERGFLVQPLSRLTGLLTAREPLPARSVVIVVDDAHAGFHRWAFPLVQQHRIPVTLFVQTDAVGSPGYMNWDQIREVAASGWVSVQARSRSGQDLTMRAAGESDLAYRRRLEVEVQTSRRQVEQRLAGVTVAHFAYPFGAVNPALLDTLQRNVFELALTNEPGGNAAFQAPLLLRRSLVLGGHDLARFQAMLETAQKSMP